MNTLSHPNPMSHHGKNAAIAPITAGAIASVDVIPAEAELSLDTQLALYQQRRFLAVPLAGAMVWSLLAITGALLSPFAACMAIFFGSGCIIYLAMFLTRFTGESLSFKFGKQRNFFDSIFLSTVAMCLCMNALAIPLFWENYTTLAMSYGILLGAMWLPISVVLKHNVGFIHGIARTIGCFLAWYLAPEHALVTVPVVVVSCYVVSIIQLERRWAAMQAKAAQ